MANDPPRARAEYLSEWRSDLSDFIPLDVIENATDYGIYERAPQPRRVRYFAFADAAGGTGADSFALAIAHREGSSHIVDAVRESKPRFVPAQVIASLAQLLRSYGISKVSGDAFAGGFHSSEWTTHGITFVPAERTTSENYLTCLPMFLAGRVRLVDNVTLRNQLSTLERKPGDGNRERVDHPTHLHDDVSCAVAGALAAVVVPTTGYPLETWQRANGNHPDQLAANQPPPKPGEPLRVNLGNGGYRVENTTEMIARLNAEHDERVRAEFAKAEEIARGNAAFAEAARKGRTPS